MNKLNLTEAKDLILNNNLGSIYSKEDVINLLNRIEEKQVQSNIDLEELKSKLFSEIRTILSDCDTDYLIDKDNAEFSISYGNTIELDSIPVNLDLLGSDLECGLDIFFRGFQNDLIDTEEQD